MEEYGIARLTADGRELGSTDGADDIDAAAREAARGLVHIYRTATYAVVYQGRSLADRCVVREVRRGSGEAQI